jgi:hypothetical protein
MLMWTSWAKIPCLFNLTLLAKYTSPLSNINAYFWPEAFTCAIVPLNIKSLVRQTCIVTTITFYWTAKKSKKRRKTNSDAQLIIRFYKMYIVRVHGCCIFRINFFTWNVALKSSIISYPFHGKTPLWYTWM